MTPEYLVLEVDDARAKGPFGPVRSKKLAKRWETLQEAFDELGAMGWSLQATVYGPTEQDVSRSGNHVEGYVLTQARPKPSKSQ